MFFYLPSYFYEKNEFYSFINNGYKIIVIKRYNNEYIRTNS